MIELLVNRRFAPLFATQFLGALNDNIFKNALVIFIAFTAAGKDTDSASMLVVLAGGVFILPFMLFSPVAGALADRYPKHSLIRRLKVSELLIMAAGAAAFLSESVTMLMGVLFLMGLQSAAFGPLKYAILPQHLEHRELMSGNALVAASTYLAIIGGTVIGGVLVAMPGHGPALTGLTTVAVACAGWVSARVIPDAPAGKPQLALLFSPVAAFRDLLDKLAPDRALLVLIAAVSWFWFVGAASLSLVPGYTRVVLAGSEAVATSLLTAFSVGIALGALSSVPLTRNRVRPAVTVFAALLMGGSCLDIAGIEFAERSAEIASGPQILFSQPGPRRALIDLALLAFAGGLYVVPLYTLLQRRAAAHQRARVIALNNVINAAAMVVCAVLIMLALHAQYSLPQVFGGLGLACLLVGIMLWYGRGMLAD